MTVKNLCKVEIKAVRKVKAQCIVIKSLGRHQIKGTKKNTKDQSVQMEKVALVEVSTQSTKIRGIHKQSQAKLAPDTSTIGIQVVPNKPKPNHKGS